MSPACVVAGSLSEQQTASEPEQRPDRPPGTQHVLYAQSSQEGGGSEGQPGGQGEGMSMQGHHSNAAQLATSQQPQEQHQGLTGNSMCTSHTGRHTVARHHHLFFSLECAVFGISCRGNMVKVFSASCILVYMSLHWTVTAACLQCYTGFRQPERN